MIEPVGGLLRGWRQKRRLSQLDLACEAGVSTRHLSFIETGRAAPSRDMLLRIAEFLEVPLRERNRMLLAAGFAPAYRATSLNDPSFEAARAAIRTLLAAHEPYPAIAVDGQWNLVEANRPMALFLEGIDPSILVPPVNVLRASLHPKGLGPRILNFEEWRGHILERLRRQIEASADPELEVLMEELARYPNPSGRRETPQPDHGGILIPLRLAHPSGVLSFLTTVTVFGTPRDITLAGIALETFFPADAFTAECLRQAVTST